MSTFSIHDLVEECRNQAALLFSEFDDGAYEDDLSARMMTAAAERLASVPVWNFDPDTAPIDERVLIVLQQGPADDLVCMISTRQEGGLWIDAAGKPYLETMRIVAWQLLPALPDPTKGGAA